MATKQIPELPSTNVSNNTDLLMTRQGSSDRSVQIQTVRDIGTEAGQSLGVGGYGIGGDAIAIDSIFASDDANLITRTGTYTVAGTSNVPISQGELIHIQSSGSVATQQVFGNDETTYFRKKVSGTWGGWIQYTSTDTALLVTNNLQEIEDAGSSAQAEARGNLSPTIGAFTKSTVHYTTTLFTGSLNVDTFVGSDTALTVGKTSRGANVDVVYDELDVIPDNCAYVELYGRINISDAHTGSRFQIIAGQPGGDRNEVVRAYHSGADDVNIEESGLIRVPTDQYGSFDISWTDFGTYGSASVSIYLRGFGVQ